MTKWLCLVVLASVSLTSLAAHAQKNEFAAEASGLFPSASNLSFEPSAGFQLNYAHRLLSVPLVGLYVEVPFLAGFSNQRTIESLFTHQNYSSLYITPGVKLKFAPGFFLSPYIAGGVGAAHYSASNSGGSTTEFAADLGGGLDIKVLPHISLRGEVRDFWTNTPGLGSLLNTFAGKTNNVIASGGVVLRF
jgi:hypothetical protein